MTQTLSPAQELTAMRKRAERAERQLLLVARASEVRRGQGPPSQLAARLAVVRRLALPFSRSHPSTAACPAAVGTARAAEPPAGAGPPSPAADRRADLRLDESRGYLDDDPEDVA